MKDGYIQMFIVLFVLIVKTGNNNSNKLYLLIVCHTSHQCKPPIFTNSLHLIHVTQISGCRTLTLQNHTFLSLIYAIKLQVQDLRGNTARLGKGCFIIMG